MLDRLARRKHVLQPATLKPFYSVHACFIPILIFALSSITASPSCSWYMEKAQLGRVQQPWNTNLIWRACVASAREESHPFITVYFLTKYRHWYNRCSNSWGNTLFRQLVHLLRHLRPCNVLVKLCVIQCRGILFKRCERAFDKIRVLNHHVRMGHFFTIREDHSHSPI